MLQIQRAKECQHIERCHQLERSTIFCTLKIPGSTKYVLFSRTIQFEKSNKTDYRDLLENAQKELEDFKRKYSELKISFATYRKDTSEEIMIEENYIAQEKLENE